MVDEISRAHHLGAAHGERIALYIDLALQMAYIVLVLLRSRKARRSAG